MRNKLVAALVAVMAMMSSAHAAPQPVEKPLELIQSAKTAVEESKNYASPAETAKAGAIVKASLRSKKDKLCTSCHDETEKKPILSIYHSKHGIKGRGDTPTCQSCHGDSLPHATSKAADGTRLTKRPAPEVMYSKGSYSASTVADQNKACQSCHKNDEKRSHWDMSKHANSGVTCASCHVSHAGEDKIMKPETQAEVCYTCHKDRRAQARHMSVHPFESGKMTCSSCHQPHGAPTDKSLIKATINETCYSCHPDKRGPFLFEHQPATEDCTTCHAVHGSNIAPLLKQSPPFLCQTCHNGPHQSARPQGVGAGGPPAGAVGITYPASGMSGRSCLNCHNMVHGSNHPAGAFQHR